MKKQTAVKMIGIGTFHAVLYLYIVPFMISPKWGYKGVAFTIVLATIITLAVLKTAFNNGRKEINNDES